LPLWIRETSLDIQRAILPLWVVLRVGGVPLVRYILGLPNKDNNFPRRMRHALERMGLTYVKLGQYLAMRRDLLPEDICRELSQLYEDVSPLTFEEVRAVVEAELQGPLAEFFPFFNQKPVAAASVAQVHEAKTYFNERVAVKVQRPGIERVFVADIRNLRRVAALADSSGLLGTLSLREVVEEFARWTSRELDFLVEGRTADRLRQNATAHEVVPVVYWDFTTRKILTMEFIDGLSLAQIISLVARGREDEVLARLPNLDLIETGHNMALASLHQLFVCGFFHGDPHPGNVIILDHNDVAFVDFGIFGELSEHQREILMGYIETLALGNLDEAVRYFSRLTTPTEETDIRAFERDAMNSMRGWYEASKSPLSTFKDRHLGKYFGELLGVVRRHRLRIGAETLLFWRAMSALDYSALSMSRHFDLLHELRVFFEHLRPGPIERLIKVLTSQRFMMDVADLSSAMPRYLKNRMKRLAEEDSNWALMVRESLETNPSDLLATRCVAAALVGVSLTVAGLGSNIDPTLLLVVVALGAFLLIFSLVKASPR
jgi:ubiquinone biosynthesis protein